MSSGNRRKPSTSKSFNARLYSSIFALGLGTTALTAVPAHAGTIQASGSISQPSDPRYAALAQAASIGQPVTIDSLTTADSQTQALPDGTLATTTTVQPTRMQNSAGAWETIDPALVSNPDGTISTAATPNALTLSGGGTGPVITAKDSAGNSLALSLPVSLPAPTLNGPSATYTDIYPGISLTVTAAPTGGFSEVFKVDDAAAEAQAQSLKFTTQLSGLSLSQGPNNTLNATDTATGQTAMAAPAAIMWDSATAGAAANNVPDDFETVTNADSSASGPGLGAHTGTLPITDSGSTLTLDGATSQLDTTAPTYPLYLDPTWTEPYQSGGTNNYTEVQAGCPTVANWDDVTQPGVGYNNINGDGNCPGYGAYETYFDLDTANLTKSDTIVSSIMKISEVYSADNSCGEGTESIAVKWTAAISSSTTWNTRPAVETSVAEPISTTTMKTDGNSAGTTCSGGTVAGNFDLKSAIVANLNNSHITFGLYGDESGSWESLERFNNNPSVYTVYDIPPNMPSSPAAYPTPVTSSGAADQDCGGSSVGYLGISNFGGQHIATLSANLTSSIASAQMQGIFTLHDDTVNATVGTYTSAGYATTGANVSVQTPALTDGHQYSWSVYSTDQYYSSTPSATCNFLVDQTAPNNPAVSSTSFPALGATNTTGAKTGQIGSFTLTSSDPAPSGGTASGLRGFYYSLDTPVPASGNTLLAASNGSASISGVSFSGWGVHTLYAQAVDNAGNRSAPTQYSFYVPWSGTSATNVPGDIDGDGIPDLVAPSGGNLVEYKGSTDPSSLPTTLSVPTDSPGGDAWTNYLTSHHGNYTNNPNSADDLWAYDTVAASDGNKHLYLYQNSGTNPFENTKNVADITKPEVGTDSGAPAGTSACLATKETGCTDYDNTDWNTVSQLLAAGDLYLGSANDTQPATNDIVTVEDGNLWLYQGMAGPYYLANPVQLGAKSSSDSWANYTVMAPGPINGKPTLWVRSDANGTIYQYTISFGSDSNPYPLALPSTASSSCSSSLICGTALTLPGTGVFKQGAYPQITSPGDLHNALHADLVATTATGELIDYPGTAPNSSGLATFANPIALGNPTPIATGTTYTFPDDGTYYPSGSEWKTPSSTLTFDQGQLTLTNNSSGATIAQYGASGNPNAYLVLQTDGNLVIYNNIASGTPSVLWALSHVAGVTTASGDSMTLHSDGSLTVNSATSTTLWTAATADPSTAPTGPTDIGINTSNGLTVDAATGANLVTGQGLATGTTASVAGLTTGGWEAAFQAANGHLKTIDGTDTITDTGYTMVSGTSPSIAPLPNGGWIIAFQATGGALEILTNTGTLTNTAQGMAAGTSPAIATNPTGGYEAAFQANTGALFTYNGNGTTTNTTQGMDAGTSPAIVCLTTSGVEVAFQANNNNLYTYNSSGTTTNLVLGMAPGTSPSIAAQPNGDWIAAVEANTNGLWTATASGGTNRSLGMQAGTSPAITGLTGGTWQIAFQANTGTLWTATSSAGTNTGQTMTGSPTITPYQVNQAN